MKRSEINTYLQEAEVFFGQCQFYLPPFASWSAEQWKQAGPEAQSIRDAHLGWDITDFGSEDFLQCGLLLFTIRNGNAPQALRPYAEKIMISRVNQQVPMHFHWKKTEDIINRGATGRLVIQFYNADKNEEFADTPVKLICDGIERIVPAGGMLEFGPGESVTIPPYVYHAFWATGQMALVGEVSAVNDDATDNRFHKPLPRFPKIQEDAAPHRLLCNEYPSSVMK